MTGTDTVGGALRAAVERVHRPWVEFRVTELRAVSLLPCPQLAEEPSPEWGRLLALLGATEAADLGVPR